MIKHGTSHGFSVLVCTILATILVELLKPLFPKINEVVENTSIWIVDNFQVPLPDKYLSIALVASALAVIWGFFFKLRYV